MDKKRLYRELAVLDDRGIKLFERCGYGPAIIDNHDDSEILLYLCEQQIAEIGILDDFSIKKEYYTLYENEIKGADFEKYRKRASWVWKCKGWCDEMYDYFPKSVLLKLVNKRMQMSESEMIEMFRKFPVASFNDQEYGDWIIPCKLIPDYDEIESNIEAQKDAAFYIPTVSEIEEFFEKGYLFSRKSCRNLYNFLLKYIGNEDEARERCFDIWFDSSAKGQFASTIKDVVDRYPALNNMKNELARHIIKFYENMNTSEFNGYSKAYARRKGLTGKGKHRKIQDSME